MATTTRTYATRWSLIARTEKIATGHYAVYHKADGTRLGEVVKREDGKWEARGIAAQSRMLDVIYWMVRRRDDHKTAIKRDAEMQAREEARARREELLEQRAQAIREARGLAAVDTSSKSQWHRDPISMQY